jgi:WD40-like Beta Propeller Repeat
MLSTLDLSLSRHNGANRESATDARVAAQADGRASLSQHLSQRVHGTTMWTGGWSPDGRHLYFASDPGGRMNLWRVPAWSACLWRAVRPGARGHLDAPPGEQPAAVHAAAYVTKRICAAHSDLPQFPISLFLTNFRAVKPTHWDESGNKSPAL